MRKFVHDFLKWLPVAFAGGALGVAGVWESARDWIGKQADSAWVAMSYPWIAFFVALAVAAYVAAIIWTGREPNEKPSKNEMLTTKAASTSAKTKASDYYFEEIAKLTRQAAQSATLGPLGNQASEENTGVESVVGRGAVIQQHSGVGHNINAHNVTLGSQFLEPRPEVFAHLAEHLRKMGIKGVNLHSLNDGNSIRILDAAKAYFEKAGFEIKGEKIVTLLSKAMPAPFFINETTIKDDVADVWFDGGTPLDRFPGRGPGSL